MLDFGALILRVGKESDGRERKEREGKDVLFLSDFEGFCGPCSKWTFC